VAKDAADLLPLVARAYGEGGRHIMQSTLAAVAYLAARNLTCVLFTGVGGRGAEGVWGNGSL